ncbi:hypothetical protein DPMN_029737 [Dreissena polymorpha]|uniref:Peptidase A2 domain-containing protein n=1 Tax=Dreissena polymorpha TaxID=45954 RepID=A0A9D4RFQ3_DREPO|nr:hypothetical protein DPMN_029737 [Dreissena polymorpha]
MKALGLETANVNLARRQFQEGDKKPRYGNFPVCNKCCRHHYPPNCPACNNVCDKSCQQGYFKASMFCQGNVRAQSGHFQGKSKGGRGWRRRPRRGKSYNHDMQYANENVARGADNVTNMFQERASINDVFEANIDGKNNTEWIVKFELGNSVLKLEIDSGAAYTVLSRSTVEQLQCEQSRTQCSETIINGVSGQHIKAFGQITFPFT